MPLIAATSAVIVSEARPAACAGTCLTRDCARETRTSRYQVVNQAGSPGSGAPFAAQPPAPGNLAYTVLPLASLSST